MLKKEKLNAQKGKVNYKVSSRIDSGLRKSEEIYNQFSPETSERAKFSTGINSRLSNSNVTIF